MSLILMLTDGSLLGMKFRFAPRLLKAITTLVTFKSGWHLYKSADVLYQSFEKSSPSIDDVAQP